MSAPGLLARFEALLGRIAVLGHRYPLVALSLAVSLSAAGGLAARGIRLDADLAALLPPSFESVRGLELLKERFGGIGYVVVVGKGGDAASRRRFADELAPKLERLPEIRWVEHRRARSFFEERALYYLELEDLEEVERRIAARERWERRKRNPLYVSLEDDEPPPLDFGDLEAKYAGGASRRLAGTGDDHYADDQAGLVVLLAKPRGHSSDLAYARRLVDDVNELLSKQDLGAYGPGFAVALTGTFQKKLDQQAQLGRDVATASSLALALMLGYLLFHFRGPVGVLLVLLPTGAGVAWTYGLVGAGWGSLNLLTGFLGAILGGLGLEHGIHLLGRYQALRSEGASSEEAVRTAFASTGASAVVSALVAALTFLSLAVSEFRAFREFGVIAAVGMLVVVLAYLAVLPAALGVASRLGWRPSAASAIRAGRSDLARLLSRRPRAIALASGLLLAASLLGLPRTRFDFDFGALEDGSLPSFLLDRQVNRILGYSQTPVVMLAEREGDEAAIAAELRRRKAGRGAASTIDFVASLDDLVPDRQREKQEVLRRLSRTVAKVDRGSLAEGDRAGYDALRGAVEAAPFGREELPASVRRQLEGGGAGQGGFVLVFPRVRLSDGEKVRELAREVRGLALPDGRAVSASGEAMVLADILEMVTREAPLVLGAAVGSVLLALWLTLGSLWTAALCLSPTVLSVLALAGLMPAIDLDFNYVNVLVVPVLIGVTVDAAVHLQGRLGEAADADFAAGFAETGRAIVGGLLTSAFGFGAMLLADHPGLRSIGRLANLGFAVNLLVMLVAFPATFLWLRRSRRADERSGANR